MAGYGTLQGRKALFEWRHKNGITRQRLAEMLGLRHSASILQYEHGKLPLTFIHLITLQKITGIPIWTLASTEQRMIIRGLAGAYPPPEMRA